MVRLRRCLSETYADVSELVRLELILNSVFVPITWPRSSLWIVTLLTGCPFPATPEGLGPNTSRWPGPGFARRLLRMGALGRFGRPLGRISCYRGAVCALGPSRLYRSFRLG